MHELSVTQGILQVAVDAATEAGAQRITAIDLVIGDMSSIVDDSVQFYFDLLSRGTLAEGAVLRFRRETASAVCQQCNHQFTVNIPLVPCCPVCQSTQIRISGGRAFYVESIEVDDEHTNCPGNTQRE
ncbi:MAG: hydrogenase maturation nickel metallochaperone HypA [Chloroflexaceae bacterium]|nr:hydrogenase maturation nickel metallochaperone HypA [Chloroflexaceae bacterium]